MRVMVNITSYNRRSKLLKLINQLKDVDVMVWDDCSDFYIGSLTKWDDRISFYRFKQNYGKHYCWMKFRYIFEYLRKTDYDYYIFLPDDVELCENFIEKSVELWEGIKDGSKISLSFSDVKRTKTTNWTGYKSHKVGEVIRTQWNDLMFLCNIDFFNAFDMEEVPLSRWIENPLISSGVGRQISLKLNTLGYSMYNISKNMVKHTGNNDSKLNPSIRPFEPL